MSKTTPTPPKSPAAAQNPGQAAAAPQNGTLPTPNLDPEQVRQDLMAMLQRAAQAGRSKAG